MMPPPDAAQGRRLTLEQALEHIGGEKNLISPHGWELIRENTEDYIWKYPDGAAWCTACGGDVRGVRGRQNERIRCPACGKQVTFRHERLGHKTVFDQFVMYEWRKSAVDPQAVTLTAVHVWRDSAGDRPELEPLNAVPSAVYVFRPGKAVTVFKADPWRRGAPADERHWFRVDSVGPEHTKFSGCDIVIDELQFREALRGTRIGETFAALCGFSNRMDDLELTAIASCARRPWLEYLAKSGQGELAAKLMRMGRIPRELVPNQRARTPRELLGLTEGQWFEARRDGVRLTEELLERLNLLGRMGLEGWKLADAAAIGREGDYQVMQGLRILAPGTNRWRRSVCDTLKAARVSEKLTRKACRRIIGDIGHASEWLDYYEAASELGENLRDARILLPRNMREMHDRMNQRLTALRLEEKLKKLELEQMKLDKRMKKLKKEFCFSAYGLVLRPYRDAREVIEEGKALGICIGSYAQRYLEGRTIICCLRRAEEPDKPWRAVEFSANGQVIQDRGYKNDRDAGPNGKPKMDNETIEQLANFWDEFRAWKAGRNMGGKSA